MGKQFSNTGGLVPQFFMLSTMRWLGLPHAFKSKKKNQTIKNTVNLALTGLDTCRGLRAPTSVYQHDVTE